MKKWLGRLEIYNIVLVCVMFTTICIEFKMQYNKTIQDSRIIVTNVTNTQLGHQSH